MADNACNGDAVDTSNRGLRISAIFIILAASLVGSFAPIILARQSKMHVPKLTFFVCKYVGTGVIIATAWLHLLAPAVENLGDECLEPMLGDYPWAFAIGLMTVMLMFFVEMVAMRFEKDDEHSGSERYISTPDSQAGEGTTLKKLREQPEACPHVNDIENANAAKIPGRPDDISYPPGGEDHMSHRREHRDRDTHFGFAGQLLSVFILEFGVIFHSVFIGLTLGTTDELEILLIVLTFHQMLEGLGLGSRLADAPWPRNRTWVAYIFALGFALSTPIGIAAGIGAQPNNANTQKLLNGIFDSISAGILMYTGLVELLAHEFMFNEHMRKASFSMQLVAFGCVAFGAGIMALLAKWA
ncbi:putative Fe2+/Zn2+ regulated transporter protein [Stachybotrys elegans]|uniref:Fe2+/Zn2+ regulated transporter protein n=1 Tax=Stachybotrys elegans TaxID=80388 RepID=A0A8K0SKA9_9HYPO|nr:putative Fe2+/Zn2+ regulated transporter protein [Stachybotrys elegans]